MTRLLPSRRTLRGPITTALVAGLATASILLAPACHTWRTVKTSELGALHGPAGKYDLRLTFREGQVEIEGSHWGLDYPRLWGTVQHWKGFGGKQPGEPRPGRPANERAFDLDQVQLVEVHFLSPGKTTALIVGLTPVVTLAVLLATKGSSCPIVQIDRGDHFEIVGEGYPGAIFKSLQREDLVALPSDLPSPLPLRLANFAEEIQYTDAAEVWAVDHAPGTRMLALPGAALVAVGAPVVPSGAEDLEGRAALSRILAEDGAAWQTDLAQVRDAGSGPLREGLVVSFMAGPSRPVLEIALKNTRWTEVVLGRFFALAGERFPSALKAGNDGDTRAIQAWREREGVDLRVEVQRANRFETVAVIPATGPVENRRIGIPLPDWTRQGPVVVRVSGALGFWRIDQVALASRSPEPVRVRRVQPLQALDQDGLNQLASLHSVDGRYQTLPRVGDHVNLSFRLPVAEPDQTRTCFLWTHGYYNALPPIGSTNSLGRLRAVRDEPGGLARFGLAFYKENRGNLHAGGTP